MLLEYLLTVIQEVAKRQQDYDYAAVVREVHRQGSTSVNEEEMVPGKGEGGGGGAGSTAAEPVTESNVMARLEAACGHLESKGDCSEAARLVKWWLRLGPEEYDGRADPPCRKDLCERCCTKGDNN